MSSQKDRESLPIGVLEKPNEWQKKLRRSLINFNEAEKYTVGDKPKIPNRGRPRYEKDDVVDPQIEAQKTPVVVPLRKLNYH